MRPSNTTASAFNISHSVPCGNLEEDELLADLNKLLDSASALVKQCVASAMRDT